MTSPEQCRVYYLNNKEKIQAQRKEKRNNTLLGRLQALLDNARIRSKKENWELNIDLVYLLTLYRKQDGKCALSGELMSIQPSGTRTISTQLSLDRIDNNFGYVAGNVQLVSARMNYMRGKLTVEEFQGLCRLVTEYSRCV